MNQENQKKQETMLDLGVLYETRIIMLLETAPQSNEYRQIILSPEQFKNMNMVMARMFADGSGMHQMPLPVSNLITINIDDRARSFYTKDQIKNL